MACILLVDNGSRRASARLRLCQLAAALRERTGQYVHPVSLQHSDKIDPARLNNEVAQVLYDFLDERLLHGVREFVALPLFFGESRALTSFIPDQLRKLKVIHGEFCFRLGQTLYPLPEGDTDLVRILHDHILQTARRHRVDVGHVVLVEHGSPSPQVNEVRRHLAERLRWTLALDGNRVSVGQAVMERREGKEYDFNGDLLKYWLQARAQAGATNIIVAMLFSLPGRHAGKEGDIARICKAVTSCYSGLEILITPLVGEHPVLVDILESRLNAVLKSEENLCSPERHL